MSGDESEELEGEVGILYHVRPLDVPSEQTRDLLLFFLDLLPVSDDCLQDLTAADTD